MNIIVATNKNIFNYHNEIDRPGQKILPFRQKINIYNRIIVRQWIAFVIVFIVKTQTLWKRNNLLIRVALAHIRPSKHIYTSWEHTQRVDCKYKCYFKVQCSIWPNNWVYKTIYNESHFGRMKTNYFKETIVAAAVEAAAMAVLHLLYYTLDTFHFDKLRCINKTVYLLALCAMRSLWA